VVTPEAKIPDKTVQPQYPGKSGRFEVSILIESNKSPCKIPQKHAIGIWKTHYYMGLTKLSTHE